MYRTRRTRQRQPRFYCCANDSGESPCLHVRANSPLPQERGSEGLLGPGLPSLINLRRGRCVRWPGGPADQSGPEIHPGLTAGGPPFQGPGAWGLKCWGGAVAHPLPPNSFTAKVGGAESRGECRVKLPSASRESGTSDDEDHSGLRPPSAPGSFSPDRRGGLLVSL